MKRTTKYHELYQALRQQIIKGLFKPGEILPSESELSLQYQVTQPTIRHALDMLVKEKLIKKHQGKGSIVQVRPQGAGILSFEGQSVTSQNDNENIITTLLAGPEIASLPEDMFFKPTAREMDTPVIKLERLRTLNGQVIFFEILHIPNIQMEGFCNIDLNNRSLYDTLNCQYGIVIDSCEQKLWAIPADEKTATLLQIHAGSPIVRLERRLETNRANFYIYSSLWANTSNYMIYNYSR